MKKQIEGEFWGSSKVLLDHLNQLEQTIEFGIQQADEIINSTATNVYYKN